MTGFRLWFYQTFPDKYTEGMTYKEMLTIARDEIEKSIYNLKHVADADISAMKDGFELIMTLSYIPSAVDLTESQIEKLDAACSQGFMYYLMTPVLPATFEDMNYRDLFLNMI